MMKKGTAIFFLLCLLICSIVYMVILLKDNNIRSMLWPSKKAHSAEEVMGPAIFFLETSDHLEPRPLVSCAVESAARIYPDRSVVFLMKGLMNQTVHERNSTNKALSFLSAMHNVLVLPLNMEQLLQDTPLIRWYVKGDYTKQKYWLHISADACRLAIIWKYGGIYMDTDIISMRRIPAGNFLAGEGNKDCSNGVFGFSPHHQFILDCMESFVENYNGDIWGKQGPILLSRILNKQCKPPPFEKMADINCDNISFLHPTRFYPISYASWRRYYEVWKPNPTFNDSYALHLWNFMNQEKKEVVPGSKSLAEHLYMTYCPTTYKVLVQKVEGD